MRAENSARSRKFSTWALVSIAVVVIALGGIGAFFLVRHFPFRRDAVLHDVESATSAKVQIGSFAEHWFPPGLDARQVRLTEPNGVMMNIDTVSIRGSYTGLLGSPKRLRDIHATGVRVVIPENPGSLPRTTGSHAAVSVGAIRIENAELRVLASSGKPPLVFAGRALKLENFDANRSVRFEISLHNPRPSGDVHARGEFGPLNLNDPATIPVSGEFTFEHADLTADHAVSGLLNASGSCRGRLGRLACAGTADVPAFRVYGSSHTVHIAGRFRTTVDATTGNASLDEIVTRFNRTTVSASGKVMPAGNKPGKSLVLEMNTQEGRIEDVLLLFTHATKPAMEGDVHLRAKFVIPPGPPDFLSRLNVVGTFAIVQGHFTNQTTQEHIDRLSESAAGESKSDQKSDPRRAPAEISGAVSDRQGVARLENVLFEAPGIRGQLGGTFALHDKALAMNGVLETSGKLSDTTSGLKTILLKAIGPFWDKQNSV
jgi:hypothetical protein